MALVGSETRPCRRKPADASESFPARVGRAWMIVEIRAHRFARRFRLRVVAPDHAHRLSLFAGLPLCRFQSDATFDFRANTIGVHQQHDQQHHVTSQPTATLDKRRGVARDRQQAMTGSWRPRRTRRQRSSAGHGRATTPDLEEHANAGQRKHAAQRRGPNHRLGDRPTTRRNGGKDRVPTSPAMLVSPRLAKRQPAVNQIQAL